ncbi:anti-sigma factor RsiW [Mitsuaria sp. BK045]|uniref:anti-sigma factor family protein n=1 Tax=unclassified Roseateles TaxID=2626991 RepID=UPI001615FF9E|nr:MULTISPECIES: anti-sigma factor [unclassified Roseateles]MBB3292103.1 anti-sigma factor RsiW [Mitsuaria sp. BK041]MBB3361320.1 anti-sigma factor RsiW [Mitsuaria sp. BK045]
MSASTPITEADLHAWVDGELALERAREIEAYLASHPGEAARVEAWRSQKQELRALFDPVQDEPIPQRLIASARRRRPWYLLQLAAGLMIALIGGAIGWGVRDGMTGETSPLEQVARMSDGAERPPVSAFAQRAAVAHAVYSMDQRRPVELDAAHEDQLVAWLSKRMGTKLRPPHLQALGYELIGGRLLPGGTGPVAQFMYSDDFGNRLTLYVCDEANDRDAPTSASQPASRNVSFRFAQEGAVNVFYWIDGPFGYAISSQADRAELKRISGEVYRQLAGTESSG